MKTMTCRQLGGPKDCKEKFRAGTFEEMTELSKDHAMEMFKKGDKEHMKAMVEMTELMRNPKALDKWMDKKEKEFNSP